MPKRVKLRIINQTILIEFLLGFICFYLLFHLGKSLKNSLFFTQKDRINVVFYGERPAFFSFGLADNVHYLAYFNHDFLVFVPGGYGRYRIGSLGKLANLEKKPSIVQNTLSSVTSTYIDFYFYPKKAQVYSGVGPSEIGALTVLKINYQTNANFLDRWYLFFLMCQKRKSDFSLLNTNLYVDKKNKFHEEDFFGRHQGYFYLKFLRDERKNLQIYYKNYVSAQLLSRVIEGSGIRVVDLTRAYDSEKNCRIIDNNISKTSFFLSKIFNCEIEKGDSGRGDIKMVLGERLEGEWE